MLESCNTSMQIHFQVGAQEFAPFKSDQQGTLAAAIVSGNSPSYIGVAAIDNGGSPVILASANDVVSGVALASFDWVQVYGDWIYFKPHGQAIQTASMHDAYVALCYSVRDYLIERARRTIETRYEANPKCVYYLSEEYLLGKQLSQNMLYTETTEQASSHVGRKVF